MNRQAHLLEKVFYLLDRRRLCSSAAVAVDVDVTVIVTVDVDVYVAVAL